MKNAYSRLLDKISLPFLVLDQEGVIQEGNTSAAELLGIHPADDLQGLPIINLIIPEQHEDWEKAFANALAGKPFPDQPVKFLYRENTPLEIRLSTEGERYRDSDLPHLLCVLELSGAEQPTETFDEGDQVSPLEDLKWLSDQGRKLLTLTDTREIYHQAGKALQARLGNCVVVTLSNLDSRTLKMEGAFGLDESRLKKVGGLIGRNLLGHEFKVEDRFFEIYQNRSLHHHSEGLVNFAVSEIPPGISRQLQKIVPIEEIYTIGLKGEQRVMGCIHIFTLAEGTISDAGLVESFAFLTALALERTEYAAELLESELQFQTIFEYAPDAYYINDLEGKFVDGNREAERITGYQKQELIGKSFLSAGLIPRNQLPKAAKMLTANLQGKSTGPDEFILRSKSGQEVPVEISTHPVTIGGSSLVLGIARDVSRRKQTSRQLDQAQETLSLVLDSVDAHIYVADLESHIILYMNERMIQDFGEDFTGRICHEVFRGRKDPCEQCTNQDLLDEEGEPSGVKVWEGVNEVTGRHYVNYDRAIRWTDQRLARMQIALDITDRLEAKEALQISEERYRKLFDSSQDAIMTLAPPDWKFTSGNPALFDLFKIRDEQHLLTITPWDLSPEQQPDGADSRERALEVIQQAMDKGYSYFQWQHQRLDGTQFPAKVQLTRVDTEQEVFLQATVRDISEQLHYERMLEQQMDDLALINKLNVASNQGQSQSDIFRLLQQELRKTFPCENMLIYLLSEDQQFLKIDLSIYNQKLLHQIENLLQINLPQAVDLPLRENSIYRKFLEKDEAWIIDDPDQIQEMLAEFSHLQVIPQAVRQRLHQLLPRLQKMLQIQSMISMPLISRGKVIGLVNISNSEPFPEQVAERFSAIADQLSGIIGRLQIEEERRYNLEELRLINETFVEGSRLEDIDEISELIADKIQRANPDSYVMVSLYDSRYEAITIRALAGLGGVATRLTGLLGMDPKSIRIDVSESELDQDLEGQFTSGRLHLLEEGLYSLTRGQIPRVICRTAERMLGVEKAYIAGLSLGNRSRGGITVFVKKNREIRFPEAIETIASHYAAIFERRQIQRDIQQRTAQLEALRDVEQDIAKELDLDDLLVSIAGKAAAIVNASESGFSLYDPDLDKLQFQSHSGLENLPDRITMERGEGLAGQVWEKGETIIVEHYGSWEGRSDSWAEMNAGDVSVIGVPVTWGKDFLGVLEVAIREEREFTTEDVDTLELFANQAAIAIQNARLFQAEKRRRKEAETLREVGMAINTLLDRSEILNLILDQLQQVLPYDSASIQLIKGDEIVVEAASGFPENEMVLGRSFVLEDDYLLHDGIYQHNVKVVENVKTLDSWVEHGDTEHIHSWIGAPLMVRGKAIGILTVDHHQLGQYSESDGKLALNFANQAAIALDNARLLEQAHKRQKEAETLREVGLLISKNMDREQVLNSILDQLQFVLEYTNATIQLLHGEQLVIEAVRGAGSSRKLLGTSIAVDEKTMIGSMLMEVEAVVIEDLQQLTDWASFPAAKDVRAWLGVPLEIQGRRIGILTVDHHQVGYYTEHDAELVTAFASQAAIALENSRLFEEAQRRMHRIESLREIDQAISGSLDLTTTLEVLLGQLIYTLEVDAAAVLLYQTGLQTLDYVSGRGFHTDFLQHASLQLGEGLAGEAALTRTMVHIPDLSAQTTSLHRSPYLEQEKFVSYFGMPLVAKGEIVGVLEVFHRSRLDPDQEWIEFLEALAGQAAIAIDRLNLFNDLERSNVELIQAYDATIEGWARAIELRDGDTEGHSRRVVQLTMQLARMLGVAGKDLANIRRGALLHDIGKMAIPDSIMLKPGQLTEEEWEVMKQHPVHAFKMLSGIEYLRPAIDIPYCHHERWDGSGYPRGLSGESIPLAARIFSVIDVWDALQSDRPYREAWSREQALDYIREQSGKQFDPQIVSQFLELIDS